MVGSICCAPFGHRTLGDTLRGAGQVVAPRLPGSGYLLSVDGGYLLSVDGGYRTLGARLRGVRLGVALCGTEGCWVQVQACFGQAGGSLVFGF